MADRRPRSGRYGHKMAVGMRSSYAGLWPRSAAFAFDYILIAGYLAVLVAVGVLLRQVAPDLASVLFGSPLTGELTGFVVLTLPVSLYFALSEASPAGATWGKRRLRLCVQDARGTRLGLPRSLLRTAVKFAPWELAHAAVWQFPHAGPTPSPLPRVGLVLVWLLVGGNIASVLLDPQRRALYDRIAGTRVVRLPASPSAAGSDAAGTT